MTKQFESENLPPHIQAIADTMNVEKNLIPPCTVPPLPFGENITPGEFISKTRKQLQKPFTERVFGNIPPRCDETVFKVTSEGTAFDGLAIRREIDIICRHNGMERVLHLLLFLPAGVQQKVPVFFGLNFKKY